MAELASVDLSLEKIFHLICNGEIEENVKHSDHSIPLESLIPSGKYRDTRKVSLENRKRKTASRLINCPFEIVGRRKPEGFWKVEINNCSHNHEPSRDMSGHPYCRRFSNEEILKIQEMSKAGISPRQIMSSLRQSNPNIQAISRNIYNEKYRIMKKSLAGRSIVQALLEELGLAGFMYNIKYDQNVMKPISCPITSELIQSPEFSPNNGEFSLFLTAFEELDILGSGAYGTVVRCRNRADNREYAIKKVEIGNIKEYGFQKVVREIQILSGLNDNCNIVRYHTGWFESSLNGKREESSDGILTSDDKFPCLYIQMELCESSLEDKLDEGKMGEKECWVIFEKIVQCLQYIHVKGFMHGDLSCRNVFFKENEVKIGDFGLARCLEEGGDIEEVHIDEIIDEPIIGIPPEKNVSVKYDIYCAGVILLRMLSLTVKYEKLDLYGTWVEKQTFPPTWEDELKNFLSSLLHTDPAMRPSTSEILRKFEYFLA